jgi:uncharacterized cupin superfamily protein
MVIVDGDDLDWVEEDRGDTGFRRKQLSEAAAGDGDPGLGCSLYELPPGKKSWPYHYHEGNAEAMYVLAGEGQVRLDGERRRIEAGVYAAFPEGEAGAHRVINDSDEPLRYLAVSTMRDPDVTVYPDSGKIGVYAGSPPGGRGERTVSGYYRHDDDVDYWAGEE